MSDVGAGVLSDSTEEEAPLKKKKASARKSRTHRRKYLVASQGMRTRKQRKTSRPKYRVASQAMRTRKSRRCKKQATNKIDDDDDYVASGEDEYEDDDDTISEVETPRKKKRPKRCKNKATVDDDEEEVEDERPARKKPKKAKKYADRNKTIATRVAGQAPLSMKQQLDRLVREKVKALEKPLETLFKTATPYARTDAYESDSDVSDTEEVANQKRYPWVTFGAFCMTWMKTNAVGTGTPGGGAFLKKPKMVFWVGSQRATDKLKQDIAKGKIEYVFCSSHEEFKNALRSESAKAAKGPPARP